MQVEQTSGMFIVQGEAPLDFDGQTDKFGSEVISFINVFAPVDKNESYIVIPVSEEGRSYYAQQAAESIDRQRAIEWIGL